MSKDILKYDLNRYFGKTSRKYFLKAFLLVPGFRFTYFFRKAMQAKENGSLLYYFYRIFHRRYTFKYSIDIPISTKIGKGFYIGHLGNVVVSGAATIGENCNISQGVTIGQTYRGKKMGAPVIGNGVWIGANSVIVGNIVIGDDVMITPLTFVATDVPAHSIVSGNPAQITPRDNATAGYIGNIYKSQ